MLAPFFNPICCNNFSKVSLDFKKMANYFRKVLHTHPDIAMYFLCDRIYRLWEAVNREVLLNYWGYLWKLSWMKFILFLICIASPTYPPSPRPCPSPSSPDMPFLPPDDSFAPSQAEQPQKLPLNKSAIALVYTFYSILSHSYTNQKNSVIKKWYGIEILAFLS